MPTKFEKLLDYLINEETEKANALFHQIVVEKSRKIYENLMTQEMSTMEDDLQDGMYDEMSHKGMEEESVYELAGDEDEFGGDPADNMVGSVVDRSAPGMNDIDGDMDSSEPASKEDVMDIKDALADLKAEFEALLSKEDDMDMDADEMDMDADEMDMDDDDMDMDDDDMDMDADEMDMDADEMDDEDEEEFDDEDEEEFDDEEDEDEDMEEAFIREYREVIEKDPFNPKGNTEHSGVNKKSPVNANPKNRPSGGNVSAHNIAQGGEEGKVTVAKPKGQFVEPKTMNVDGTQAKGYSHKQSASKSADKGGVNSKSVVPK